MQQVCHQLIGIKTERLIIKQGQEQLCRAFINTLRDDTFQKETGAPLQSLARFLYQTLDIRNTRNPRESLHEKSLETKLYKIVQELKEQQEDPFFENNANPAQKR